jgi:2-oxo-3-hexenedioate decarboxylase
VLDPGAIATRLATAAADRQAIPRLTAEYPELTASDAYAAQRLLIDARVAAGEVVWGAKLGLTSRAKQQAMGVSEPLYGWLTSEMLLVSGEPADLDRFIHPRVEPEIAFLLDRELSAPASLVSVLAATAGVCAALELIDSRYAGFDFRLADVIADNSSAAGVVLGPVLRPIEALEDLRLLGCVLWRNGAVVDTASGSAVFGHPAAAVAWLVNELGAVGRTLPAGSIVLSGGLTNALPLSPGVTIAAEIDQLGYVEVSA